MPGRGVKRLAAAPRRAALSRAVASGMRRRAPPRRPPPRPPAAAPRRPTPALAAGVKVTVSTATRTRRVARRARPLGGALGAHRRARRRARCRVPRRAALVTTVGEAGLRRRERCGSPFRSAAASTVRVYRPRAAVDDVRRDAERDAGAAAIRDPAAVPRRLDARARRADRVPGSRLRRRRVHRERTRHGPRDLDARRARRSGAQTRRTGRWRRRPRSSAATLVVHGMDGHVWVLHRSDGRLLLALHVGSPIESSPVVARRRRLLRRLERPSTRSTCRRTSVRWTALRRLQDHLVRGDRRRDALHRRLLRPRARRSLGATGRAAVVGAASNGRDLRHARGRGRPRVRARVDRRLADRVHDRRPLPLAPLAPARTSTRRRRSRPAASSSARTTARFYAVSARDRARRSGRSAPAARSPARGRRRRRRVRGLVRRTASSASTRGPAACSSASRTASTSPSPATDGGCSCTATRASTPSTPPVIDAVAARSLARRRRCCPRVLVGGGLRPTYLHVQARGARHPRLLDRRVRHDAGRRRRAEGAAAIVVADVRLRPRRGTRVARHRARAAVPDALDVPRAAASSSSRPRSATGASTSRPTTACSSRSTRRPGSAPGSTSRTAASPRRPRSTAHGSSTSTFLNQPPCNRAAEPALDGEVDRVRASASGKDPLAPDDRPVRVVAARRAADRLRRRLERPRLGARRAHRQALLALHDAGGR